MTLTKQEFTKYIQSLQDNWDFNNKLIALFNEYYGDIGICEKPDCSIELMELLLKAMDDKSEWISYYCYELDFGRNWKPGMITDGTNDIPLRTIDDLWDLLNNNLKSV